MSPKYQRGGYWTWTGDEVRSERIDAAMKERNRIVIYLRSRNWHDLAEEIMRGEHEENA